MTDQSLECGLDRLDGTEQGRYGALRAAMRLAVEETREVPDGYAIRLRPDVTIFRQVAEWISLERRCCPFLCLTLQWSDRNAVWLTLTGGPGVKEFLAGRLAVNS
jgi:hypothetical protein